MFPIRPAQGDAAQRDAQATGVQAGLRALVQPYPHTIWAGHADPRMGNSAAPIGNLQAHFMPTLVSAPFPLKGYAIDVVQLNAAAGASLRFCIYRGVWSGRDENPELRLVNGSLSRYEAVTTAGNKRVRLYDDGVFVLDPGMYFFAVIGTITSGAMWLPQTEPSSAQGMNTTLASASIPQGVIPWGQLALNGRGALFGALSPEGYTVAAPSGGGAGAPLPAQVVFLPGEDGADGEPGSPGVAGVTGATGPAGPASFMLGDYVADDPPVILPDLTKLMLLFNDVRVFEFTTTDGTVDQIAGTYTPTDGERLIALMLLVASRTDGGANTMKGNFQSYAFRRNGATTTQVGTTGGHLNAEDIAAWDLNVDTSGADIRWKVTGEAGSTIKWYFHVFICKL